MGLRRIFWLAAATAFGATLASASGVTFVCNQTKVMNVMIYDPDTYASGTCAYLNSTVAGYYDDTFSNANALIYVQMGDTGLGESTTGFYNDVTYTTYLDALQAEGGPGVVRSDAVASLPGTEPALYNGADIEITSALGNALNISGMVGTTADGNKCFTPGTGTCYNGIITITTPANLTSETGGTQGLYWDQNGGTIPGNDYDFYSVVEHETDEVLGTASCIGTTSGSLVDDCGGSIASAVDLFRYNSSGNRVFIDSTAGAFFAYNGVNGTGATNGVPTGAVYNTLANGDDYADFSDSCLDVQDATGCLGQALNITTDGGGEINILDAVGYNLVTPEPGTLALFGAGFAVLTLYRRRRRT